MQQVLTLTPEYIVQNSVELHAGKFKPTVANLFLITFKVLPSLDYSADGSAIHPSDLI